MSVTPFTQPQYQCYLYSGGVIKALLVDIINLKYGEKRIEFLKCTFDYPANKVNSVIKQYMVVGSELKIFRKGFFDTSIKQVWSGEIQQITIKIDDKGNKSYSIVANHWGEVFLLNRILTKTYTSQEESAIAWDLINTTQTNTFSGLYTLPQISCGITQGTLETTSNLRTRTYTNSIILPALQDLANAVDQGVNPSLVRGFRLTPDLLDPSDRVFSYYGSGYAVTRNIVYNNPLISTIEVTSGILNYANRIEAHGSSGTTPQIAYTTNSTELANYHMRQRTLSATNIQDNGSLSDAATNELNVVINKAIVYKIKTIDNDPFIGQYRCGDVLTLNYQDDEGLISINAQMQIFEIDISVNKDGIESVDLIVAVGRPAQIATDIFLRLVDKINNHQKRLVYLERQ